MEKVPVSKDTKQKASAFRKAFGDDAAAVVFCEDGMMHVILPEKSVEHAIPADSPAMRATVAGLIHHEDMEDLWTEIMNRIHAKLEARKAMN